MTLPTCIGPLRFADTFVLVGDHVQTAPLVSADWTSYLSKANPKFPQVRSAEAKRGGMDVNLLNHLSRHRPEAAVELAYQYRMNDDIMSVANTLIYDNPLKCGSEANANQRLDFAEHRVHCAGDSCWIDKVMQPRWASSAIPQDQPLNDVCNSVKTIFLNTDQVPAETPHAVDSALHAVDASLILQVGSCIALTSFAWLIRSISSRPNSWREAYSQTRLGSSRLTTSR